MVGSGTAIRITSRRGTEHCVMCLELPAPPNRRSVARTSSRTRYASLSCFASLVSGWSADHAGGMKLIDSTLIVVLHNGEQEIERELASPADALRVALMMLARRGRLEIGDVLKVLAPN